MCFFLGASKVRVCKLMMAILYIETFMTFDFDSSLIGGGRVVMVLGKLPVPGRPTNLNKSRARAYCAFNRCG